MIDIQLCDICQNDGKCLNNETHKDYEKNNEDFFGTDLWDCTDYLENVMNHLNSLNIEDQAVTDLYQQVISHRETTSA